MDSTSPPTRSRGRSRGGRGKAIRARGRGGRGRAAEFAPRLVLEHEQNLDDEEEEERQREIREKYAKRELASNAHRYEDPPEDENAEDVEPEPEVDLSSFIEKQKLSDASSPILSLSSGNTKKIGPDIDDDDIDHTLDHLFPSSSKSHNNKGKHEVIEWDEEVEAMKQAKEQAEAHWGEERMQNIIMVLIGPFPPF
ncbi:hypothetical protein FRC02_011613 [Tulasnella sp. 418]|nr:hypothetical protein FRC02_011613 [Tulasnella sp. 418]